MKELITIERHILEQQQKGFPQATELHQRTPLFIGSKFDVDLAEEFIQGKRR